MWGSSPGATAAKSGVTLSRPMGISMSRPRSNRKFTMRDASAAGTPSAFQSDARQVKQCAALAVGGRQKGGLGIHQCLDPFQIQMLDRLAILTFDTAGQHVTGRRRLYRRQSKDPASEEDDPSA